MRCRISLALLLCAATLSPSAVYAKTPDEPADPPAVKSVEWAHIELKGSYPEGAQRPELFGELAETLGQAIGRLDKAADDDVAGVVLQINNPTIGWAKMHEFSRAVDRVQAKGKKVYAVLDMATTMDYLVAASCDRVIMPESGVVMLTGLRAEVSFYKNLFDKLDVKAEMLRVGEYKSAAEPYSRTEMSPQFREEMEAILDDYYAQIVETIAAGRKLDAAAVKTAIDNGPYTAAKAKELGLIDEVGYADELERLLKAGQSDVELKLTRKYGKKKVDTDFSGLTGFLKLMNLMMGVDTPQRSSAAQKIAVIHATGAIMTGKSQQSLFGGQTLGSETLVKAIEKAAKDAKVKAIVLRVDSPGGSALASDLIWRALEKTGKPVVVSMGDVAASGGYYISMGADLIFAEPGTITGSIGVVGGKLALKGLFEKVGITTTVLARGKNSGIMSLHDGFTDSERAAMQKLLDDIYKQFTTKAAQGRKMEYEQLEKLARGRIYTGRMAVQNGLVDKLGTLEDAVAQAKELAGLKEDDKVERLILPKPTSPLEALFGPLDGDASMRHTGALSLALDSISPELAAHLQAAGLVNLLASEPRLVLMPFRLIVR